MKLMVFFLLLTSFFSIEAKPVEPVTTTGARSYIVIDGYTNEIIEGNNINLKRSVASISKIMTAIIALESGSLFEVVTADESIKKGVGSSIYLELGDQITVIELVYGLLLRSGNDAAIMIAKAVAGSEENFVSMMNQKAKLLGMSNSIFHNPHGLDIDDEGNISTAYDMAILMSYCLNNELFLEINSTKEYRSIKGVWRNKNKLLHSYSYLIGGKTGFTTKARRTLVTAAEKDYHRLICVTLDCGGDFATHRNLYQYYFGNYTYVIFLLKGKNYIDTYCIYSEQTIGLRILYQGQLHGIKVYNINVSNNSITISFHASNGSIYQGGTFDSVFLESYRDYI